MKTTLLKEFDNKYALTDEGDFVNVSTGTIRKLFRNNTGYTQVKSSKKTFLLHRLLALYFVPNPDPINYTEVHHIDGNKQNNNISNLLWCSREYNIQQAMMFYGRNKTKKFSLTEISNALSTINNKKEIMELLESKLMNTSTPLISY